jgi:hypothetical protein
LIFSDAKRLRVIALPRSLEIVIAVGTKRVSA